MNKLTFLCQRLCISFCRTSLDKINNNLLLRLLTSLEQESVDSSTFIGFREMIDKPNQTPKQLAT